MKITFTPTREDSPITLDRDGDALIVNGLRFDFSDLPEGADLPAVAVQTTYITGTVTRTDGQLSLKVRLPHGQNAPHEAKFPDPITVDTDGSIDLPAFDILTDEDGNAQEVHGEAPSVTSDGLIDWSQMVTVKDKAQEANTARREAVNTERTRRLELGTTINVTGYGLIPVQGRDQDQITILALENSARDLQAAGITDPVIPFRDRDNGDHILTPSQVLELMRKAKTFAQTVYQASWVLKDADPVPEDYTDDKYWP